MGWGAATSGARTLWGALFMVGRYGISLNVATTAMQSALGAAGSFGALLVWV